MDKMTFDVAQAIYVAVLSTVDHTTWDATLYDTLATKAFEAAEGFKTRYEEIKGGD